MDCDIEPGCAYSAPRLYQTLLDRGEHRWPLSVVVDEFTPGGTTATFTMTAFTRAADRRTRLFGTRAELTGDGETIRIHDFLSRADRLITPGQAGAMNTAEGHGGGDAGLMDAFTGAVATGNPELIMSGPLESLASHLTVFAAERARLNGAVEKTRPELTAHQPVERTAQVSDEARIGERLLAVTQRGIAGPAAAVLVAPGDRVVDRNTTAS